MAEDFINKNQEQLARVHLKNAKRVSRQIEKKSKQLDEINMLLDNQENRRNNPQREHNLTQDLIANQEYMRYLDRIANIKKISEKDQGKIKQMEVQVEEHYNDRSLDDSVDRQMHQIKKQAAEKKKNSQA